MPPNRDSLDTLETPSTTINEPWEVPDTSAAQPPATVQRTAPSNPEEIQRIQVEEEDRLAFRVGVNLITLVLLGLGIYFLVRYLWF